jgi:hypothetical protein
MKIFISFHFLWLIFKLNEIIIVLPLSQTRKTTRIRTKPRTKQGKQIIRNANLSLTQDYKHTGAR